jgi:hypothetical protein
MPAARSVPAPGAVLSRSIGIDSGEAATRAPVYRAGYQAAADDPVANGALQIAIATRAGDREPMRRGGSPLGELVGAHEGAGASLAGNAASHGQLRSIAECLPRHLPKETKT